MNAYWEKYCEYDERDLLMFRPPSPGFLKSEVALREHLLYLFNVVI